MAEKNSAPPTFKQPKHINSPELLATLNNQVLIQSGILLRKFRSVVPIDPQELNTSSRTINFSLLERTGLINPQRQVSVNLSALKPIKIIQY